MKTIVLAGGAGFLGRLLTAHFRARGERVILLTRSPKSRRDGVLESRWDGASLGAWVADVDGADVLINLAGRSVNCRYTRERRAEILHSRLRSTEVLGLAVARCVRPPVVWLNASSATIYRAATEEPMDEATGALGDGFSEEVCRRWEATLQAARTPFTRKVALRLAMVMAAEPGSALPEFERLARFGLGGAMAGGRQYVSWLHAEDFCRALDWLIATPDLTGPVNLCAPQPLPNADFLRALRDVLGVSFGIPPARWLIELGAVLRRTETELLLKSRRVVPRLLEESGFCFRHPRWPEAVADLLSHRREPSAQPTRDAPRLPAGARGHHS